MLKIALVLVKNVFFGLKKDISELLHWVAPKLGVIALGVHGPCCLNQPQ